MTFIWRTELSTPLVSSSSRQKDGKLARFAPRFNCTWSPPTDGEEKIFSACWFSADWQSTPERDSVACHGLFGRSNGRATVRKAKKLIIPPDHARNTNQCTIMQ